MADLAEQTGKYDEVVFFDDNSNGIRVFGKCKDYTKFKSKDIKMYPAFGNNQRRIEWENMIEDVGIKLAKLIHPLAYVSPKAEIVARCIIMPYAIVNTSKIVNKVCIINIRAMVNHDCILEAGCHLSPGAIVKGENRVPTCTKIDSGVVIMSQHYKK